MKRKDIKLQREFSVSVLNIPGAALKDQAGGCVLVYLLAELRDELGLDSEGPDGQQAG